MFKKLRGLTGNKAIGKTNEADEVTAFETQNKKVNGLLDSLDEKIEATRIEAARKQVVNIKQINRAQQERERIENLSKRLHLLAELFETACKRGDGFLASEQIGKISEMLPELRGMVKLTHGVVCLEVKGNSDEEQSLEEHEATPLLEKMGPAIPEVVKMTNKKQEEYTLILSWWEQENHQNYRKQIIKHRITLDNLDSVIAENVANIKRFNYLDDVSSNGEWGEVLPGIDINLFKCTLSNEILYEDTQKNKSTIGGDENDQ